MRKLALLVLLIALPVHAQVRGVGRSWGSIGSGSNPLSLPLLQASDLPSTFQFLGSFVPPTGGDNVGGGGGAMSVSGSTLYHSINLYDINDTNRYFAAGGLAAMTIPTLTGTPAYDGSNGAATALYSAAAPGAFTAAANYTATICQPSGASTPQSGDTSCTFSSVPAGISSGAGWYMKFNNNTNLDYSVTAVSGNTLTWSTALGAAEPASVSIYQWNPSAPWGNSSGYNITGSLVINGTLYVTGTPYYDVSCSTALGWILTANANLTGWGGVNTVQGQGTDYSRRYAGPLYSIPSVWQSAFGAPYAVLNGAGLSGAGCPSAVQGFSFTGFNPASVSPTGTSVPLVTALDYFSTAGESLGGRDFSGPFPTSGFPAGGSTYGQYTLASAPAAGATSITLQSVYPNNSASSFVTGFLNTSSVATTGTSGGQFVASAPTGGWPATWAANYWNGGFLRDLTSSGECRIEGSTAVTSGSTGTLTLSCPAGITSTFNSGDTYDLSLLNEGTGCRCLVTFSDGEQRVVQITVNSTGSGTQFLGMFQGTITTSAASTVVTVNSQQVGQLHVRDTIVSGYIPQGDTVASFGTYTGSSGAGTVNLTSAATGAASAEGAWAGCASASCTSATVPLTCSPSCSNVVTMAPLGDDLYNTYDGPVGTALLVPGTRTLLYLSMHQFGPGTGRPGMGNGDCQGALGGGPSGSNDLALPPDTVDYMVPQLTAYDAADVVNQEQGHAAIYAANPYGVWSFPGYTNWVNYNTGCIRVAQISWATYDPATSILYADVIYQQTPTWIEVIDEWKVNAP